MYKYFSIAQAAPAVPSGSYGAPSAGGSSGFGGKLLLLYQNLFHFPWD